MGAPLNRTTDESATAAQAEQAPRERRDARDRMLLGAGALFAFLAMGASMVALNRDVPFLDMHIERASIQQSPTTTATLPTTTTAVTAPVASTTTSGVAVATTEAPTTTVLETTTIPTSTVPTTAAPVTTTPEPVVANTVPQDEPEDDPTEVTIVYQAPTTTTEAPPATAPEANTGTQPTTTTTPAPTTTTPAGPQLSLSLPCAPNAGGVTFTVTTRADGTVRRVRLSNLPNACTDVKVRITLKNAAGADLGTDAAKVRSTHWVETSYSGFQANLVTQIVATPDN